MKLKKSQVFCSSLCLTLLPLVVQTFELSLIHINDIHARFEETDQYSGLCKKSRPTDTTQECYGGIARVVKAVKDLEASAENSIFLNGGDFFQGTSWYTLFKWRVVAPFAEKLNFTASSPGNHEFDDGINGYLPFVQNITSPIVCANVDFSREPALGKFIKPSVVVERSGVKIGVIGYLTTGTGSVADTGNLTFYDEVEAITKEAKKLKAAGVNILIALGHSGYEMDQKIAAEVEDIDVVVGGHSHTLLYTGTPDLNEKSEGDYPTLVTQSGGKIVPVVQSSAFTKYLGHLKIIFNENGEATNWTGYPILLDSSVQQDPEILEELKPWREQIKNLTSRVIGETNVVLENSRLKESNLGNFVADSMVDWFIDHPPTIGDQLVYPKAGFIGAGIIRTDLQIGKITLDDLLLVLPFSNTIDVINVKGSTLLKAFEHSGDRLNINGTGRSYAFLHVAGFEVTYDVRKEAGHRVSELLIRCHDWDDIKFQTVDPDQVYPVVTVGYIADGGDGFVMFKEEKLGQTIGPVDVEAFEEYLKKKSPVQNKEPEGRIKLITDESTERVSRSSNSADSCLQGYQLYFISLILITHYFMSRI